MIIIIVCGFLVSAASYVDIKASLYAVTVSTVSKKDKVTLEYKLASDRSVYRLMLYRYQISGYTVMCGWCIMYNLLQWVSLTERLTEKLRAFGCYCIDSLLAYIAI